MDAGGPGREFTEILRVTLSPESGNHGCQIPKGVWYSVEVKEESVIFEAKDRAYAELEKEATMCLLSYMESAFRTDFVMRCDLKKKDKLSLLFRKSYDRNKRKYQYGFNDVVIKGWKEIYPEHKTEFDRIVEMMNYRNWLAHGRYWKFKDNIAKYSYSAVHNAIESLENAFQSVIMRPSLIGEAVSDGI